MMHRVAQRLILLTVILIPGIAHSQSVSLQAVIDSAAMAIGQQTTLHLTATGPASSQYTFPSFEGDTLITGLEVVKRNKIDTVSMEGGYVKLHAAYQITSFDSGLYYIPPIKIVADTTAVYSNELAIKIVTYDVDTANYKLFDIKGVQSPPVVLSDYLIPFLWGLFILALILLIGWFYLGRKRKKRHDEETNLFALLPPHIAATMELDKLKAEKPWKSGKNKEYYTRLTDIIRNYMERRFQINALEMTSSEILALFYRDKETISVYQNLKQILSLSDLVKFAKLTPQENEHEMSLMNAYLFVNQTKVEEVQPVEEQKEDVSEPQDESQAVTQTPVQTDADDHLKKYQPK